MATQDRLIKLNCCAGEPGVPHLGRLDPVIWKDEFSTFLEELGGAGCERARFPP